MVEIIPKPVTELPLWQKVLFYFSVLLLIASILAFFLLNRSFEKAESELQSLEETLSREKTQEEKDLEREVFGYQEKIEDFSELSKLHLYPSKFFNFFQELCHPQIWFSEFLLNLEDFNLSISGETENFSILGQQILIFQQEEKIKNTDLSEVSIGKEGKVNFTLDLYLKPEIFK
jgi:hypothetical protein